MELFNEPIIQKKTLSDVIKNDNVITNSTMVGGSFNGGKITIGSGNNIFTANKDGIFLGSSSFSTAPFRVDMAGNMTASSATISGDLISSNYNEGAGTGYKLEYTTGKAYFGGAVITGDSIIGNYGVSANAIGKAINNDGNLIGDIINYKLDTFNREILDEFTFQGSGGIAITYDYYSGVWLSPSGIIGKKYGNTTFGISASGDAVFEGIITSSEIYSGYIQGAEISGGYIDGAVITGGTVQTSEYGERIILNGSYNRIDFAYGSTLWASIEPYSDGNDKGLVLGTSGNKSRLMIYEDYDYAFIAQASDISVLLGITYANHILPADNLVRQLGDPNHMWRHIFIGSIMLDASNQSNPEYIGEIKYHNAGSNSTFRGGLYQSVVAFDTTIL